MTQDKQMNDEELYATAVDFVVIEQRASTSYVQRKLRIGYNRAAEIIDRMEKEGVVSSVDAVGRREVLKKSAELPRDIKSIIEENPHIGKYARQEHEKQQNKEEKEPVLPVVEEADKYPKNEAFAVERLRSIVERAERLEEEKAALSSDIRDIFAEAKSSGFDVKTIKKIIKLRKMEAVERDEEEFLLETYRKVLDI